MTANLHGIIPVLATPFHDDESLDLTSLRRLIDRAVSCGVHGVAVLGAASEFYKLGTDEREEIIAVAAEGVAGRLPLVVGVTALDRRSAAALARLARQSGAAAVFATAPFLTPLDANEAVAYFRTIAEAGDLPVMIQDAVIPGGGGALPVAVIRQAAEADPRICYVKEESANASEKLTAIRTTLGDRVRVLTGRGGISIVDDLRRGAVGNMPGSVMLRGLARIYDAYQRGDTDRADELHRLMLPMVLFRGAWGSSTKEILRRQGIIESARQRPPAGARMDEHALAELARLEQLMGDNL